MIGTSDLGKDLKKFRSTFGKEPAYVWVHPEMPMELKGQVESKGVSHKMRHHVDARKDAFILSSVEEFSPDGE